MFLFGNLFRQAVTFTRLVIGGTVIGANLGAKGPRQLELYLWRRCGHNDDDTLAITHRSKGDSRGEVSRRMRCHRQIANLFCVVVHPVECTKKLEGPYGRPAVVLEPHTPILGQFEMFLQGIGADQGRRRDMSTNDIRSGVYIIHRRNLNRH